MYIYPSTEFYQTLDAFLTGRCKPAIIRAVPLLPDRSIILVEMDLEKMDSPECYYKNTDYEIVWVHDDEDQELYIVVYRKR